jgi:hypothetical protein
VSFAAARVAVSFAAAGTALVERRARILIHAYFFMHM